MNYIDVVNLVMSEQLKFAKMIKHLPKRKLKETPQEYAKRVDIDLDKLKIESDHYTGEILYKGFGWWNPEGE